MAGRGRSSRTTTATSPGSELFILCGHGFSTGLSRSARNTIGPVRVAVPDFGWKIVVMPPGAGSALSRITPTTRVIVVLSGLRAFRGEGAHGDRSVVDACVVGRTAGGELAGVSIQLVET